MNLKLALKSLHVQRWHIVHTTKYQSIAEHMYGTWLIAMAIYDALYPTPHNSIERAETAWLALTHDLPEVLTGDMPSSAKELMGSDERRFMDQLEGAAFLQLGLDASASGLPRSIVRLADLVEATYFAHHYIPGPDLSADTQRRLGQYMDRVIKDHPHVVWAPAFNVITNLLGGMV